jgi:hypothetical protein
MLSVVGVGVPAPHERAALLLDEQVPLAAALPHLADLRQLAHRDLILRSLDRPSVVRPGAPDGKRASRS